MLELLIANLLVINGVWTVVAQSDFKMILLLTGLIVLTGGLWSAWYHRQQFSQLQTRLERDDPAFSFERRKHQRRGVVGGLVASCGIVLAGFFWVRVHDGGVFAILLGLLLLLIVGITILAIMDMVSIGLKHGIEHLAEPDTETDQAIAAAIAKHQSENLNEKPNASSDDHNQS